MSFPLIVSVEAIKQENDLESGVHRHPLATEGVIKIPVKEAGYKGGTDSAREETEKEERSRPLTRRRARASFFRATRIEAVILILKQKSGYVMVLCGLTG